MTTEHPEAVRYNGQGQVTLFGEVIPRGGHSTVLGLVTTAQKLEALHNVNAGAKPKYDLAAIEAALRRSMAVCDARYNEHGRMKTEDSRMALVHAIYERETISAEHQAAIKEEEEDNEELASGSG